MKKLPLIFLLAAVCVSGCRKETRDEKLRRESIEFSNKNCPQEIDPYTTMDSARYDIDTRTYTYYYTVRDFMDNDSIYTEEVLENFRQKVISELRTSISVKSYKDSGLTFAYEYHSDKSGKTLVHMEFTKEEYK